MDKGSSRLPLPLYEDMKKLFAVFISFFGGSGIGVFRVVGGVGVLGVFGVLRVIHEIYLHFLYPLYLRYNHSFTAAAKYEKILEKAVDKHAGIV